MTKLVWLALLLALLALAAPLAQANDDFESELAVEAPEFAEQSEESFATLESMGEAEEPEASFAELSESAEAEGDADEQAMVESESEVVPWHRDTTKQPVNRNGGDIQCLDGDCTRATKVHSVKVGSYAAQARKKPTTKLDLALAAVKEEIMVRAKELHLEKDWTKKVAGLIDEYQQKLQKVSSNIVQLRTQTKALLRKKKQIQNVMVQNKLRAKLKLATADLNRLQKQMEHIAGKENEFAETEKSLKDTMNALKNSLYKLRGQEPQKLEAEGIKL